MYDFGHEYVWHCHILSHEENDMMRSVSVRVPNAVPDAPSNLVAVASGTGNSRITLAWVDNSNNETGFRVQRSTGGAYDNVATLYPTIITYLDTSLSPETTYTYRVVAFNTFGDSSPSNTASATTGTFPTATGVTLTPTPASPQNLGTLVSWVAAASGGTGYYEYQFQYRPAGTTAWTTGQFYSANATWVWDTTTAVSGNNEIMVSARSVGTTAAVSSTAIYRLTGGAGPATNISLTATPSSPQYIGTSVTWSAAASGGSGTYEYQYQLYNYNTTTWSLVKGYAAPGNGWTWDTTGLTPGLYWINIWARSAGSAATFEVDSGALYQLQ